MEICKACEIQINDTRIYHEWCDVRDHPHDLCYRCLHPWDNIDPPIQRTDEEKKAWQIKLWNTNKAAREARHEQVKNDK